MGPSPGPGLPVPPPSPAATPASPPTWRGLQLRFLLGALGAALVFAVAAGALGYRLGQQRAEVAARGTVQSLQSAVEKTAAIAVFAHDPTLMREIVEGVARSSFVRSAEIDDARGQSLMRSTGLAGAARAASGAAAANTAPAGDAHAVVQRRLVSPFDANELLGTLRIDLDEEALRHAARDESLRLALLMTGQALLIALVIYLTGLRLVSRPITRLAGELAAMPPGATGTLAMPAGHAHDEIGRLVNSANALLRANAETLQREIGLRHEIEAMEAQYRQIFDSTSAGIFVVDRDGRLINGNPTVLRMIGGEVGDLRQLRGSDFLARVFARPERVRQMIEDAFHRGETMSGDLELRGDQGETRWAHCLVSVQEPGGAPAGPRTDRPSADAIVEGVLYDITERKRAEHDVRRRAERDALTGALNRSGIEETIDRFLLQAGPDDHLTLLYLDLDGFKQINDNLGHAAGDVVLQRTVQRMTQELRRATDVIGRLGGDEFLVVMQHADPGDVTTARLAERLLARVAEPFDLGGTEVRCGVSIGLAGYPRHGRTRRELLHAADEAMYAVKRHGKNAFATAAGVAG